MKPIYHFLFIIFVSLLLSCTSKQVQTDCKSFKRGHFKLHSELDNSVSIIDRNDTLQTETNPITGQMVKAAIKWTNDCEYELTYLQQNKNSIDTISPILQIRPLKTKIIKATKDYYVFTATMADTGVILTDTLFIIR